MPDRAHTVELMSMYGQADGVRSNHASSWEEILDITYPFMADMNTNRAEGNIRTGAVFDNTSILAARQLMAFMENALFPPGSQWFRAIPARPFHDDRDAQILLRDVADTLQEEFDKSSFYSSMPPVITQYLVIGNGLACAEGDEDDGLEFEAVHMSNIWWQVGKGGRPNLVIRRWELPADEAYRHFSQFGTRANLDAIELAVTRHHQGWNRKVEFLQFVYRRPPKNNPRSNLKMQTDKPVVSDWVMNDGPVFNEHIFQGGSDNFGPIPVRRRPVPGEQYGRGIGHEVRPNANGSQSLQWRILKSLGLDLDPPKLLPADVDIPGYSGPGSYYKRGAGGGDIQVVRSGSDYNSAIAQLAEDRNAIQRGYLADVLGEPQTQPRSAEESEQRRQRAFSQVGSEALPLEKFLDAVLQVSVEILYQKNRLPQLDAYAELTGLSRFDIEFVSPFFTAQRALPLNNMNRIIDRRIALFQATQDPRHVADIDWEETHRLERLLSDAPPSMFLPEEVVQAQVQLQEDREDRREALLLQAGRDPAQRIPGATLGNQAAAS